MRASLFRTGSVPVQKLTTPGSPKVSLTRQRSICGDRISANSSWISLHLSKNGRRGFPARIITRASSESDMIRSSTENSGVYKKLDKTGSRSLPASIADDEYPSDNELQEIWGKNAACKPNYAGIWPESGIPLEEIGVNGGRGGDGGNHRITTVTGGNGGEGIKLGAYYEEMLKSNPTDALLLGNYGKFLYEVEKDMVKAEEYCGRAILESPGDGELLSLYGKLIWETERDEDRAKSYFDQAVRAAPDDCMVLGSYAHFMWEAEEEEDEKGEGVNRKMDAPGAELIAAF